jgi:hypothetical protein
LLFRTRHVIYRKEPNALRPELSVNEKNIKLEGVEGNTIEISGASVPN